MDAFTVLWVALTLFVSFGVVYDRWLRDVFLRSAHTTASHEPEPTEQPAPAPVARDLEVGAELLAYLLNHNVQLHGHLTDLKRIIVGNNAEQYTALTRLIDAKRTSTEQPAPPAEPRYITVNNDRKINLN